MSLIAPKSRPPLRPCLLGQLVESLIEALITHQDINRSVIASIQNRLANTFIKGRQPTQEPEDRKHALSDLHFLEVLVIQISIKEKGASTISPAAGDLRNSPGYELTHYRRRNTKAPPPDPRRVYDGDIIELNQLSPVLADKKKDILCQIHGNCDPSGTAKEVSRSAGNHPAVPAPKFIRSLRSFKQVPLAVDRITQNQGGISFWLPDPSATVKRMGGRYLESLLHTMMREAWSSPIHCILTFNNSGWIRPQSEIRSPLVKKAELACLMELLPEESAKDCINCQPHAPSNQENGYQALSLQSLNLKVLDKHIVDSNENDRPRFEDTYERSIWEWCILPSSRNCSELESAVITEGTPFIKPKEPPFLKPLHLTPEDDSGHIDDCCLSSSDAKETIENHPRRINVPIKSMVDRPTAQNSERESAANGTSTSTEALVTERTRSGHVDLNPAMVTCMAKSNHRASLWEEDFTTKIVNPRTSFTALFKNSRVRTEGIATTSLPEFASSKGSSYYGALQRAGESTSNQTIKRKIRIELLVPGPFTGYGDFARALRRSKGILYCSADVERGQGSFYTFSNLQDCSSSAPATNLPHSDYHGTVAPIPAALRRKDYLYMVPLEGYPKSYTTVEQCNNVALPTATRKIGS
ncbi:uncharacterized protein LACBIDRAFT_322876 [Laccaria bicolor S238N-H82]|uniref:Predicted protein n=1 Tax=Laccaria bicolor (strain S238N-H82 / ATCC MYA-4686) TaxID=486041 RepID=B0CVF1_LACBS|nr:uncharacterized protein LACBIDRAFT_322876 [Laccaria bicolor S238N-H82]EDR13735.1 predicted protein [Laccaria bicolor S238N-H82]|eukprot:XP_001876233.1 predicted protein [Laccaria bicolor S238N-H82]